MTAAAPAPAIETPPPNWRVLPDRQDDYVPFKVTALMVEPIIYNHDGLHIDGILAAAAYAALDERTRRRIPPLSAPWAVDIRVPLSRWVVDVGASWRGDDRLLRRRRFLRSGTSRHKAGRGLKTTELWGWCGSAVQATWLKESTIEVRKRPDMDAMKRYTSERDINTSSGPLRAHNLEFPTVFARELTWYALGDPELTLRLLRRHIRAIGKKHNVGNGIVESWSVEQVERDMSVVDVDNDGYRLMRRMPVHSGLEGRRSMGAIRPPYHHHSRVVESVEPTEAAA